MNIKLDLESLKVLDAIDRLGSFEKAAQSLHKVRSAISYTIQKLEQDLEIVIFDRSKQRAVLTSHGKLLLDQGRHLLEEAFKLEQRIKQAKQGWEMQLTIAIDALYPIKKLLALVEAFYQLETKTFIKIQNEVFGGTWDAIISERADLVIGAFGANPNPSVYQTKPLGSVERVLAVSKNHPLAMYKKPITADMLSQYRSVAIGDSSRALPPQHTSYLKLQDILTVGDMNAKFLAQCMGLGIGFLPKPLAMKGEKIGKLVIKEVKDLELSPKHLIAWRKGKEGKALKWFVDQVLQQDWQDWDATI